MKIGQFEPGKEWQLAVFDGEVPINTVAYREEDGSWSYWKPKYLRSNDEPRQKSIAARRKAHEKHGENPIETINPTHPRWLSILVEEVGKVSHELTYDADGSLRAELLVVLAVTSAWLDAIEGRKLSE